MNISASIGKLAASAVAVYKRFPLFLVFSTIIFYFVLSLIYEWKFDGLSGHRKFAIIWGIILGLPLYFNLKLIKEWALPKWIWISSLVLFIAIPTNATYMLWNEIKDETEVYIQLATFIFVHGIVSTTAYLKYKAEKEFWQYNSLLLLNFINSSFYIAVITIGTLAGFGLISVLFKEYYYKENAAAVAFVACFIHPLLFLVWLPSKVNWQERITNFDLPKFFRTLIVFILIPLSIAYLVILYVYIGNAIVLGELPKGTIGWTVLTFTVASVFALVLVYPYRKNEDQKLVYWFSRLLPFALSPLVVLLWVAILMRVGDYGFTPSRVLLTLLAIWLTLINIYLYTGKKWGLMPLAGILTLLCVVAIGWPVNVKSLSIWSQQSIQRKVLEAYNIAEGDTVTVAVYNKLKDVDKEKLIGTNSFLKNSNSSLIRLDTLIPEYYYEFENYTWCYLDFEEPEDLSFLLMNGKTTLIKDEFNLGDEKGFEKELNPNYLITLNKDSRFLELKFGDENTIYKLDTLILKGINLKNEDNISKVVALKAGNNTVFIVFDYLTVQFELDKKSFKYISVGGKAYLLK
jgi:hypothetical protein